MAACTRKGFWQAVLVNTMISITRYAVSKCPIQAGASSMSCIPVNLWSRCTYVLFLTWLVCSKNWLLSCGSDQASMLGNTILVLSAFESGSNDIGHSNVLMNSQKPIFEKTNVQMYANLGVQNDSCAESSHWNSISNTLLIGTTMERADWNGTDKHQEHRSTNSMRIITSIDLCQPSFSASPLQVETSLQTIESMN